MNRLTAIASFVLLSLLTACGPGGKISGKVVIEGGTNGGILVRVLGPTSVGVVTDDTGAFAANAVADGTYQVIAEVPNTDVETQRATVKVTQGKADVDPTLSFKASVGKISGKVVFNDASDASGLTVALSGTDTRGVQTDSGGAFEFTGLKAGAYLVSAEVPGSLEQRQSMSVVVPGAGAALPDLTFTLLGTLTGNVKAGMVNAPNAVVSVPGTSLFTVTDSGGDFILPNVPTGMHTVMARLNAATASQPVTVAKGANTPLAFALTTALSGTVQGSIGFAGSIVDTAITVSAAGTTYTVVAAANGDFRLSLPPGAWEIVADARNYPRKTFGVVLVAAGATVTLPTAKMTVARRITFDQPITAGTPNIYQRTVCDGDTVLAQITFPGGDQLHLIDTLTLNRRVIASGVTPSLATMSPKCKWAAFVAASYTVLHNVATGEQRMLTGAASELEFSTDESVLFYFVGAIMHRYTIASGVDDTFAYTLHYELSRDRWLISNNVAAPFTAQLVTTTGTAVTTFTAATTLGAFGGAAYALTDCTVTVCNLRVLGTSGATVSTYNTAQVPLATTLDASSNSNGEWYHFRTAATTSILVKTSSGVGVTMPLSTQIIRFNYGLTRVAYIAPATAQALREEAVPPTGTSAPVANSTTTFSGSLGWLSDTRFMAFDNATPRRIDIKAGVTAIDSDVTTPGSGPFLVSGSLATWGKQSTNKRMAVLGDSNDVLIDVAPNSLIGATQAYPNLNLLGTGAAFAVPKYAAISNDPNTYFVIDQVKNEVRKLNGFATAGSLYGNMMLAQRPFTGEVGVFASPFDQFLQYNEPGNTFSSLGYQGAAIALLLTDNSAPRDLLIARFLQQ